MSDPVAVKTVRGTFFSLSSSGVTIVSGFIRSILLARLLAPEDFGVVTLALFFLSMGNQIRDFGFNHALIHRDTDIRRAASTHFVLRVSMALVMMLLTLGAVPLFNRSYPAQPQMVNALMVLSLLEILSAANSTPDFLLRKELEFKYLAILDVVSSLSMTIVAPAMAWAGCGYWALVGERAVPIVVRSTALWGVRRPWQLSLDFDGEVAQWYFQFGSFVFLSSTLTFLLDQFDDFWTGTVLGAVALGFYSRAYEFARYPRRVIGNPITRVFFPAYAKLQHDRKRLSKAFYRASSFMIRLGFLFSLVFALVVPEFVRIFIGDKWLPMVSAFRLMLLYTLLDPLVLTAGQLVTAVGQPQILTRIKAFQLLCFVPAVVILARYFGINGVAVGADLMLVLGMVLVLPHVRQFADFSWWEMFRWPSLALCLGGGSALLADRYVSTTSDWLSLLTKGGTATVVYTVVLLAFEYPDYRQVLIAHGRPLLSEALAALKGRRDVS
ncbi:MAG: lipopolysaccharide biosynthesis protein [bacterium]